MKDVYCNESLGKILYEDKIKNIEFLDFIGNFLSIHNNNKTISKDLINSLTDLKKNKKIQDYYFINKYNYKNDFFDFLNSLKKYDYKNNICIGNGINDIGYILLNEKIEYTKDLNTLFYLQITEKDIITPIIIKNNKMYKDLNYETINYINNLDFTNDKKILIMGNDLGYIEYLLKDTKIELFLYDNNEELFNFTINNIYNKINKKNNITYINDIDIFFKEEDINQFDKIIILSDFIESFYYFINFKLFKYQDKLNIINSKKIELKLKEDLRDFIYTEKNKLIEIILDNIKDDNLNKLLYLAQLDYIEMLSNYFNKNELYFDNYKMFNKFLSHFNIQDLK